jgi:hypothetical protein
MGALEAAGGCYNGGMVGLAPTASTRDWRSTLNEAVMVDFILSERVIICCSCDGDDMNIASGCDWILRWRNKTQAGSFATLASTGEIKWATDSNLVNNQALIAAEAGDKPSSVNCTGKSWSAYEGWEVEGASGVTNKAGNDDTLIEVHWAIDISGATVNEEYEFQFWDDDNAPFTGGSTMATTIRPIIEGKITGVTKNADRSAVVDLVTVTVYESDEAGTNPKPTGAHVAQVVSTVTTGAYSITGLAKDKNYFLHFYKDDTADISDGSGEVTAVAL